MKSLTIGTKFRAGFLALFSVTLILGVSSVFALRSMNQTFDNAVQVTARKIQLSGEVNSMEGDLFLAQRAVILAAFVNDKDRLQAAKREFEEGKAKLKAGMDALAPLLSSPEEKRLLQVMQADLDKWLLLFAEIADFADAGNPTKANLISYQQVRPIYADFEDAAYKLTSLSQGLMAGDQKAAADQYIHNIWIAVGLLLVSFLVGAGIFWLTTQINTQLRRMVSELASGADQVAAASGQIATTSQSLSQGSTEQASAVEEISASMEKMASLASTVIGETAAQVGHSNVALSEMVGSMNSIKASSERVAKINKTIDEIAFQTNILALNAAVEAARAGEAGKGFAVVADEVRNLAQRAAAAAKDTAALIEESIVNSNQGVLKVELVSDAIRGITDSSGKIKELVGQGGGEGAGRRAQGSIQQVSAAIQQVNIVTQSNAANAEESAAAAEQLNAQSMTVRELVNKLRHMVDGNSDRYATGFQNAGHFSGGRGSTRAAPSPVAKKSAQALVEDAFPMDAEESGSFRDF